MKVQIKKYLPWAIAIVFIVIAGVTVMNNPNYDLDKVVLTHEALQDSLQQMYTKGIQSGKDAINNNFVVKDPDDYREEIIVAAAQGSSAAWKEASALLKRERVTIRNMQNELQAALDDIKKFKSDTIYLPSEIKVAAKEKIKPEQAEKKLRQRMRNYASGTRKIQKYVVNTFHAHVLAWQEAYRDNMWNIEQADTLIVKMLKKFPRFMNLEHYAYMYNDDFIYYFEGKYSDYGFEFVYNYTAGEYLDILIKEFPLEENEWKKGRYADLINKMLKDHNYLDVVFWDKLKNTRVTEGYSLLQYINSDFVRETELPKNVRIVASPVTAKCQ